MDMIYDGVFVPLSMSETSGESEILYLTKGLEVYKKCTLRDIPTSLMLPRILFYLVILYLRKPHRNILL